MPMLAVHVAGAEGPLGRRVLTRLSPQFRIADADEADVHVHLGAGDHDARARRRENVTDGAADVLHAATQAGARHLVLVSSAMVYGAYDNNAVPLTEDAILRPDVEFVYARQLAAVEALADQWRVGDPSRTVTVLRPAVVMAADGTSAIAAAIAAPGRGSGSVRPIHPPSSCNSAHLDDLAAAVALAVAKSLDGVFNVAPDGWIEGERVRALTGSRPRVKLPDRVAKTVAGLRWRFQRGPIPPGLWPYTRAPWVIANDRLKAEGWQPTVTNEQAYVEGTEARWWTMISPKRRQEISLGAMGTAGLVGLLGALSLGRRWHRRRQGR